MEASDISYSGYFLGRISVYKVPWLLPNPVVHTNPVIFDFSYTPC